MVPFRTGPARHVVDGEARNGVHEDVLGSGLPGALERFSRSRYAVVVRELGCFTKPEPRPDLDAGRVERRHVRRDPREPPRAHEPLVEAACERVAKRDEVAGGDEVMEALLLVARRGPARRVAHVDFGGALTR